jgi:CRISPR-associated protein Csd1
MMLLSALNDYYHQVLQTHPNEIAHPGWGSCKVGALLVLDEDGKIRSIVSTGDKHGVSMVVPEHPTRSSGIKPFFLCDTSSYLLGDDTKGKPDRAQQAFDQSKKLHLEILEGVDSPIANAVRRFYQGWDPSVARSNLVLSNPKAAELTFSGGFLLFAISINGLIEQSNEDEAIQSAWANYYYEPRQGDKIMRCLVTGERRPIAVLHPPIKGVKGAQSSGAQLVSFNTRSGESYGHEDEQGLNAPVSKEAAQGYGTALNYLLSSPIHHTYLGDTTIVYWSRDCDDLNSSFLGELLGKAAHTDDGQKRLDNIVRSIVQGKYQDEYELQLDSPFYIVGFAPNAARIAVRFFLVGQFGEFVENIAEHYRHMEVIHAPSAKEFISPYALLHSVENPNTKKPIYESVFCAPLMRSILNNTRYPEGMYESTIVRIRATQNDDDKRTRKVNRTRAAFIRAYLLQNTGLSREEITVTVNEDSPIVAYNLGRLFSILESLQYQANGSTNLANRYMNSASVTPELVYPILLRLANAHLNKVGHDRPGLANWYKSQIAGLLDGTRIQHFPNRLSLTEQGEFFLGYYEQYASKGIKKKEQ